MIHARAMDIEHEVKEVSPPIGGVAYTVPLASLS
jgi:hypothetical protein